MQSRRAFLAQSASLLAAQSTPRPNILWISCEDSSPQLGCYGDPLAITPNLDKLATQGVRYTNAHSIIGVCAPSRSGIITGVYPTSLGTLHMRCDAKVPNEIRCFPEFLRNAGYYCTNNVKTDYNFQHPKSAWDEVSRKAHWKNRPAGKPFFAVFNNTVTHESHLPLRGNDHIEDTPRVKPNERRDPSKVAVPPYYPDTPEVRRDLANVHDVITQMDYDSGDLLKELEDAGLAEDTIVFFWSDHGVGLPRAKRWLYGSSTRVPLIVRIPAKFRQAGQGTPGATSDELVSLIDLGPTVLNLAGVPIPSYIQSRAFLGPNLTPKRKFLYGARDRMDERYDMVRMVFDGRYRYIRNFDHDRPHYQHMNTPEKGPTMIELRRLHKEGKLTNEADRYFQPKPVEELYDSTADKHEVNNLATKPEHQVRLEAMRKELFAWMRRIRDIGFIPEPEIMRMEAQYGNRMAILRAPENAKLLDDLIALETASQTDLRKALKSTHVAVRARAALKIKGGGPEMESGLTDESATVRIAAAKTLVRIPVLIKELTHSDPWTRLAAAQALDELGGNARPALDALRAARKDENRYVARVANHAVNQLTNSNNDVA
ncbi:MAG: sulfatase-like hydrolase/transferase [Acidobacteria bacterium]|nr:sulfatase-like hydrolase/transferase [Acidobacteriota bacterium]